MRIVCVIRHTSFQSLMPRDDLQRFGQTQKCFLSDAGFSVLLGRQPELK
jgi:hypothetical protein